MASAKLVGTLPEVGEVVGGVVVVVGVSVGMVDGPVVGPVAVVSDPGVVVGPWVLVLVGTGVGSFLTRVTEVQLPASALRESLSV